MELKLRKYLNNLPRYKFGKLSTHLSDDLFNTLFDQDEGYGKYYTFDDNLDRYLLTGAGKLHNVGINAMNAVPQIASTGILAYGDISNAFGPVKDITELMGEAGTSNVYTGGIGWQKVNNINRQRLLSELSTENTSNTFKTAGSGAALGGSIGMMFGPIGGAVGAVVGGLGGAVAGLIGGSHRKHKLKQKLYLAQQLANRTNLFNLAGAISEGLSLSYYNLYGDTTDDILYANKGKDLIQPKYGKE